MKRGWLILSLLALVTITVASAKTYDFTNCWGATLCSQNYTCGVMDGICVDDFFVNDSKPYNQSGCGMFFNEEGYSKCVDPDCTACIEGVVKRAPPNLPTPIQDAVISYEQNIWNGVSVEQITSSTTTNESGEYKMNINAGNEIYIIAQAQGYSPSLVGPLFNVDPNLYEPTEGECIEINFSLSNGTCQGDCTREGSPYCDADCEGLGTPQDVCNFNMSTMFNTSEEPSRQIPIQTPYSACSQLGVQSGSFMTLGNFTHQQTQVKTCVRVSCCEGVPFEIPCPDSSVEDILVSGAQLENAIKVTKIANDKGAPIKIRVYYWE